MDEQTPHRLTLDQRGRLTVSGVEEVAGFDETAIRMTTRAGTLLVRGSGLHIEMLSLDGGDLVVNGKVDALVYEDPREQVSLLARLLRG